MKLLLLSDTHGKLDERIAVLATRCDYAVHAGDIGNQSVLEALRPRRALLAVYGNNDLPDKWPRGDLAALTTLAGIARLPLPGGELVVTHGDQYPAQHRHQKLREAFPEARAIVYGHSHRLAVDQEASPWVLNPGAAGRARTFGGPSCLLLEITHTIWRIEAQRFTL